MDRVDYESLIIQDLLNFHGTKALDISPWYQRRSVWTTPQKSYLINTIFEKKPVPSIYIRHQIDIDQEKSIKEVVDGQQRVRSIISYRNDEFAARHPNHNTKVLFSELGRQEKASFLSTALSVGYLIGADDRDVIEIFGRINSIAKTLNPQEKRNAQYSGDFKQFCLRQAVERLPFWRASKLFSANDIARMQEVQFVSDLVVNLLEGLSDFSPALIDRHYRENDEVFPREQEAAERLNAMFERLVALPPDDFSDTIFRAPQITFSLMLVVDSRRENPPSIERLHNAIRDIDATVTAFADLDVVNEIQADVLSGFTSGNLHRIANRRIRARVIAEALG